MKFTDIFIERPVLATVISLVILLLGIEGFFSVEIREFPKMENTVITVTTAYPGAPQDLIQGFITVPIQTALSSAEGIDYLSSSSTPGQSQIQAYITLNYDPNAALAEILSKVAQTQNQLPPDAQQPVIQKQTGSNIDLYYLGFYSETMTAEEITEYLNRVVQPLFQTVDGVSEVDILGAKNFSMRIWLNPQAMAARQVSPTQVLQSIQSNNYQAGAGKVEGYYNITSIDALTTLQSVDEFKNMVVKSQDGTLTRMGDIATIELGAQSYDSQVFVKGKPAVAVAINQTPDANPLTVIDQIKTMLPEMKSQMPAGLEYDVLLDQTLFIRESISDVNFTIWLTGGIVILVIFFFMGNFRAVAIPVITIPLSLIGVIFFMQAMGFSLNLLTLLAMVLAIGLVVDDAIVVVENVQQHIDKGTPPIEAAKLGAREIAAPVIVMTITLAAVYAPIGFLGGLTGALFREFAFTLAGSVVVSGIIALTLSPMMSSRFLKGGEKPKMEKWVEHYFQKVRRVYERALDEVLANRSMILLLAVVVLTSIPLLFVFTPSELAPQEDMGSVLATGTGPMYSNIDYSAKYTKEAAELFSRLPENEIAFSVAGFTGINTAFVATTLKDWSDRKRTQQQIQRELQKDLRHITGMQFYTFGLPPLPSNTSGLPMQFVITTQSPDYTVLYDVMTEMMKLSYKSGKFIFIDNSLKMDKPQIELSVNTSKAGELGVSMQEVGQALAVAFGDNYINYFNMEGRSYQVIPQVARKYRLDENMINDIYITTAQQQMIPLKTVVDFKKVVKPNSLSQFNQMNSATLNMMLTPGVSMGEGIAFLEKEAKKIFPKGFAFSFTGQSRQMVQQGNTLIYAFIFAIILIFLVLAAKFESWRDPLVVMISVPMAISGALIFMNLGVSTINIYSEVGLVTLIGLISKHGILIVEFANQLQEEKGLKKFEAIREAAAIRLRPVLMTTFAMVIAMIPLILASGAGAQSHHSMGWVIFTGMSIGTLFTLLVVPVMYTYIAKERNP